MADVQNSRLMQIDTGILPGNACIVLMRTEWNAGIVDRLESGCVSRLKENGAAVQVFNVPGVFEIPFAVKRYWELNKYRDDRPHAFIALGCVLRGDTPHFDYVCQGVTQGITQLNLELPVPTIFGILTVNNAEQAEERLGGSHGHKGDEAAITAIKMIALARSFAPRQS